MQKEEPKMALWCDHVNVQPMVDPRGLVIASPDAILVVEDGKVKLMCKTCFGQGLTLPFAKFS